MDAVLRSLERAGTGLGQIVAVVGDPGVGKSRLVWEVPHSHRTQNWLVVESGSVSYGKATAYLPVISLLRTYFQVQDRDDIRKIREKVTGKLLALDQMPAATLPAFLALLDVPVDELGWRALDPPQRRQRTLEALKRLLLRESQVQPLLLVFEDLHWIDGETQALLDGLVESLPSARIVLLVNYRPEYAHQWGSKTYYTQLRLDPLPPANARELLDGLLGHDASIALLTPVLIERTQGNPFFLEESVRTLIETGVLVGERGAHRLTRPLPEIQVPATVEAILAARIDRLPAENKRLLQSAAVIGKDVSIDLLRGTAELPEDDLRRGLAQLQAREFLYETSLLASPEYTFKHALTHEVAYGSLLHERRRALHERIVETIERLHGDRLTEHVERLAYHAFRAEVWNKTLRYMRQAGQRAAARSAHGETVVCLDHALAALGHLLDGPETRVEAIDLRFELRDSLFALGEVARIPEVLGEAERMADVIGDRRRVYQALALARRES
jgi:predicted ATPase